MIIIIIIIIFITIIIIIIIIIVIIIITFTIIIIIITSSHKAVYTAFHFKIKLSLLFHKRFETLHHLHSALHVSLSERWYKAVYQHLRN